MSKAEATRIAQERLASLRELAPKQLERYVDKPVTDKVTAGSGVAYQVETQAFWDDRERKNLRVMVSVDDGGWRSFAPVSDDFIVTQDGAFVSE